MDPFHHGPFESSSSSNTTSQDDDQKVEPGDLLEESWFFGNLLETKTRMLRTFSDSCSPSNYGYEVISGDSKGGENSSPMGKIAKSDGFVRPKLVRTPSMPNSRPSREENRENREKESVDPRMGKSTPRSSHNNLFQTPSLPPSLGKEEVMYQDTENEFSMGKLIRQASLEPQDLLPARHSPKGMKQSNQRNVWQQKQELEGINMQQHMTNQRRMRKSLSDLESEQVQGYRDLGFKFQKNEVKVIPGLQNKDRVETGEESVKIRPYRSSSTIPKWVDKRSEQDMKAQIKFWARAVASNVR